MRLFVTRTFARFLRRPPEARATPSRPRARTRARRAVAIFPFAFVAVLLAAWAVAETVVPEITDTDYHVRLRLVRAAAAEHPDRPLGLLLGSSRTVWSFQPEQLTEPDGVYWVNASHVGAGPTLDRLLLHRYLRDGVRPAVVVVELMPTFFVKENNRFVCGHFAADELTTVRPYADRPLSYEYYFLRHRITRAPDIARVGDPFAGQAVYYPRGGRPDMQLDVTPAERERRTAFALKNNGEYLRKMTVRPGAERALRDTLREAADHGVRVVLLRSPEGPAFRSWYDPDGLARFDRFVAAVAAEHGAAVLDARLWLEEEDFYDSHHVLKRGADKFTARFAREVAALLGPGGREAADADRR